MSTFGDHMPEIEYPTRWNYRIVATSADALRTLVAEVVGAAEHSLQPSKSSSSGRYVSYKLVVVVDDEAHRIRVFEALAAHETVRYVL